MNSEFLGHLGLLSKTIAILVILFLDLTKKIHLSVFVILAFAFSGLILGFIHQLHEKKEEPIYDYHYHNLIIGVFSVFLLSKRLI
jgi:hypothetical protein